MTYDEQIEKWVNGESVHGEQCCPDFSCCRPELKWSEDQRRLWRNKPELRYEMALMALSAALSDQPVHIAGFTET